MTDSALGDATILEIGDAVSAAYAGRLLAGFGARVIKVEHPARPSATRSHGPFRSVGDEYEGGPFSEFLNGGKESLTVAWDDPYGAELVSSIMARCGAVLDARPQSERPESHGRSAVTIDMFATQDPFGEVPGSEFLAQMLGNESLGYYQRAPLGTVPGDGHLIAGSIAAFLVAAALLPGTADAEDVFAANVAIRDALLVMPTNHIVQPMFTGHYLPRPDGPQPMNVLPCEDGVVNIQTGLGWKRMVKMLGDPELLNDDRFNTFPARLQNIGALDQLIGDWASGLTRHEIFERAAQAEVPAGPLLMVDELQFDPHFRDRQALRELNSQRYAGMLMPAEPFRLSATPWRLDRPAPKKGQHLNQLLGEFASLTPEEVVRLRNLGIV